MTLMKINPSLWGTGTKLALEIFLISIDLECTPSSKVFLERGWRSKRELGGVDNDHS